MRAEWEASPEETRARAAEMFVDVLHLRGCICSINTDKIPQNHSVCLCVVEEIANEFIDIDVFVWTREFRLLSFFLKVSYLLEEYYLVGPTQQDFF